jgi:hypothetical protein
MFRRLTKNGPDIGKKITRYKPDPSKTFAVEFAMKTSLFLPLLAILLLTSGYAHAADAGLTDGASRRELFQYAVALEFEAAATIPEPFALPDDAHCKPE